MTAIRERIKEEKERIEQRETVERLAKAKPDEVAQLVRAWLGDE